MAGPFNFIKPPDADQTGYDPGVNRQTLGIERVSEMALTGEGVKDLTVAPNNTGCVDVTEPVSGSDTQRRFRLTGLSDGDAMLEAKDATGTVVAFMQVHVGMPPPSLGPPVSAAPRTAGRSATAVDPTLRTSPFPAPYVTFSSSTDPKLQAALDFAISSEPAQWQPMTTSIVALNPDGTRPQAQFKGSEVHYGASLIKIAAMYTAFELRATVRSIADELGASVKQGDVLKQASAYLDPLIMAKAATISPLAKVLPGNALPRYFSTFDVVPKSGVPGFTVNFSANYQGSLAQMIGPSNNNHAAQCIHGVGYGYINGTLASAGFFDTGAMSGIWLAGDYQEPAGSKGKYPYFRIPAVNDTDTAQGGSSSQLARWMALLADRLLVGRGASAEMLQLMTLPPAGERYSELGTSPNFSILNVKIGFGPLKPTNGGQPVLSEASLIKHTASDRLFAVGWLNLPNWWTPNRSDPITTRLSKTFDKYLTP
jgi:hypothetical protein